jgi:hypothetical protein
LAVWFQATRDLTGWKLEKKDRPNVGDYLHSEFRKTISGVAKEIEPQIRAILESQDASAKSAVCRLDRTGLTLDGWKNRTINAPVSATARGRVASQVAAQPKAAK